jgi:hypothetical protein
MPAWTASLVARCVGAEKWARDNGFIDPPPPNAPEAPADGTDGSRCGGTGGGS